MKGFLLGILWLSACTYAGYRLTDYSFRFVDEPSFGLSAPVSDFDAQALSEKLLPAGETPQSWYASLPPATQQCLARAVGQEMFQAALAGQEIHPTPAQSLAVAACLK